MAIATLSDVVVELKKQKSIQKDTSIAVEKLVNRFNEFLEMQETLNMKLLETEREKKKDKPEKKTKTEKVDIKGELEKGGLSGFINKLALAAGILVGYLTATFKQIAGLFKMLPGVVMGLKKVGNFIRATVLTLVMNFKMILDTVKGLFSGGGRLQKVGDAFRKTIELFTKGLNAIRGAFAQGGRLQKVGDGFRKVIGVFRRAITAIIRPFKAVGEIFSKMMGGISKVFGFGKAIGSVFAKLNIFFIAIIGIWEGITGFIDGFKEKSGSLFDKVTSGFFQAITDIVNAIVFSLADLGKNVIAWILDKLGFDGLAEMLRSFSFQDMFSGIMEGIESLFLGIKDFIVGLFKGVTTGDFSQMFKGLFAVADVYKMIGEKFLDLIRGAIRAILPDKDSWFGKVIPDAVYKFLEEPPPAETTPPAAPEPAPINENSEALAADPATLEPLMQSAAVMTPEQREELARVNPALRPAMEERGLLEASAPTEPSSYDIDAADSARQRRTRQRTTTREQFSSRNDEKEIAGVVVERNGEKVPLSQADFDKIQGMSNLSIAMGNEGYDLSGHSIIPEPTPLTVPVPPPEPAPEPTPVPVAATASAFPGRQETAISSPTAIPATSVVPGIVYDLSSPENFIANNRDALHTEAIRQAQIRAASGQSATGTPGAETEKVSRPPSRTEAEFKRNELGQQIADKQAELQRLTEERQKDTQRRLEAGERVAAQRQDPRYFAEWREQDEIMDNLRSEIDALREERKALDESTTTDIFDRGEPVTRVIRESNNRQVTGGVTETGGDSTVRSYGAQTFTDTEESRALDAEADRLQAEFDKKTSADQWYMLTDEGMAAGNRIHQLRLEAQSKKIESRGEDTITRYPPRTTGANINQTSSENSAMSGAPALALNAPTTNVNNSSTSNTAVSTGMPSASDSQDRSHLNSRIGW